MPCQERKLSKGILQAERHSLKKDLFRLKEYSPPKEVFFEQKANLRAKTKRHYSEVPLQKLRTLGKQLQTITVRKTYLLGIAASQLPLLCICFFRDQPYNSVFNKS